MSGQIKLSKGKPFPLGVSFAGNDVNIAVECKDAEALTLVLYKNNKEKIELEIPSLYRVGDVYGFLLKDFDYRKYTYNFFDGKTEFSDPYAKKIAGCDKWGSRKPSGCFHFTDSVTADDVRLCIPYSDTVIYQLHVRGFSRHQSAKVKHRGCFEGVVEKIPYLKDLGITAVELMPVYDFDEIIKPDLKPFYTDIVNSEEDKTDRINYWGFCDGFYFAPKSAYSGIKDAPASFNNMVRSLHEAGIEVLLQFYFPPKINVFMVNECLKHWRVNYNVDGFRLMGDTKMFNTIAQDSFFTDTKLLFDNVDRDILVNNQKTKSYINVASYGDEFMYDSRKFLKGDEDMVGLMSKHFSFVPYELGHINYITNYYGFTLNDLVSFERKHNENNGEDNKDGNDYNFSWNCGAEGPSRKKSIVALREKLCKNAMMFVLLSAATPLIRGGDEFLNSQKGNNNAYCQDNAISYLNWNDLSKNQSFYKYVKELIEFRKNHSAIHPGKAFRMMDNESKGFPDLSFHGEQAYYPQYENYNRHLGLMYNGDYAKDDEPSLLILYNMYWNEKQFALPKTKAGEHWKVIMKTTDGFLDNPIDLEGEDNLKISQRSACILCSVPGKKSKTDKIKKK